MVTRCWHYAWRKLNFSLRFCAKHKNILCTYDTRNAYSPTPAPELAMPATLWQPFWLFRLIFFFARLFLHGPSPVFIVFVTLLYIGFIFSYSAVSSSLPSFSCSFSPSPSSTLSARTVATNVAGVNVPGSRSGSAEGCRHRNWRCLLRIIVVTICTYFINSARLLISAGNLFRFALLIRAFYCIYWFLFVKLDFQLRCGQCMHIPVCLYDLWH